MTAPIHRSIKIKAIVLLIVLLFDTLTPIVSYALTGGPSQPEVQSFEPVGTSEMVDVFSGDFNYNIPLLDVNGYPINISYHAGISMDQEASWVGLGWNINPGTINRSLQGLPDDMKGEQVTKEFSVEDNWTVGLTGMFSAEILGKEMNKIAQNLELNEEPKLQLSLNLGLEYNRYKGIGWSFGSGLNFAIENNKKLGLNSGLSLGYSDRGGLDIEPNISMTKTHELSDKQEYTNGFSVGGGFNSRAGVKDLNLGYTTKATYKTTTESKKFTSSTRGNSGITYSSSLPSYTPGISMPMKNFNMSFSFKSGYELFGLAGTGALQGAFSNQYIADQDKSITKPGYGYMYEAYASQSSTPNEQDYLMDFNRFNDGQVSSITPYLPWANHSFDIFSVAAQGVGGTYRLYSNDVALLHDDYMNNGTGGGRIGVDAGAANLLKGGLNLGFNYSNSESGAWIQENTLKDYIGLTSRENANAAVEAPGYEPVYFREVNELVPQNDQYVNLVGNQQLVQPFINGSTLSNFMYMPDSGAYMKFTGSKSANISTERTHRNTLFIYKTVAEAEYCLNKKIISYPMNDIIYINGQLYSDPERQYNRDEVDPNLHHITEVEILNSDGSRHIFGIPAYNRIQIEKSFRVNPPNTTNENLGLAPYDDGDDTKGNDNGIDHYYNSTTTPQYAHSYLLTAVLSPDYVDMTGDGVSDDDLGTAVKLNYTRASKNYGWRAPYEQNMAKHSKGLHSDQSDDMGNYVFGRKEVWYLHSIEGKTHIAKFVLSLRDDAVGAQQRGGKDLAFRSYKLDRIELYSKRELKEYGEDAVPIKTVHFLYDYSLCKGVSNQVDQDSGKLTLKEIYFTYGTSQKGRFNSYKFTYNDDASITYHPSTYDRWGTYSPDRDVSNGEPSNGEFPYTTQVKEDADSYASLWNLSQIDLPSGGTILVEYESDDYAYVQDKRAMRMMKITNFGRLDEDGDLLAEEVLYADNLKKTPYEYVFFELEDPVPNTFQGREILRKEYLRDQEYIQVTAYTKIKDDNYEYIKTYVEPAYKYDNGESKIDCGTTGNGTIGWFRFKLVEISDEKEHKVVNPIAKAAWDFTRINLGYLVYPGSDRSKTHTDMTLGLATSLLGFFNDLATIVKGPNSMLLMRNFCREIDADRSWVRLYDPDRCKLGGGHRVKSIKINDNWDVLNSEDPDALASEYGQEYSYTKEVQSESGTYTEISSGVAAYEPGIGRDENPFVQPHFYDERIKGVPDMRYTFEHPIGENYFPGASVGYSRIKVNSIRHENQNPQHRTGYSITEFYTYHDFPIKVTPSKIDGVFPDERFSGKLFSFGRDAKRMSAGQGYLIELNDMHGKPKANWTYSELDNLISGVEYKYLTDASGNLSNTVMTVHPDGSISNEKFGINIDFSVDTRYMKDKFFSADGDINLDAFAVGLLPLFIPTLWPDVNFGSTEVTTATVMKVVRRKGLHVETIAYKEGAQISTRNLLYDAKTAEVLLTSVDNEFGNQIYSFKYPAHWAYDKGMGQAFQNWGLEVKGLQFGIDGLTSTNSSYGVDLKKILFPGDMCLINREGKMEDIPVWVNYNTEDELVLILEDGSLVYEPTITTIEPNTTLRILRSGRRNMASVSIGSVTCMTNPIKQSGQSWYLDFEDVLSTSAIEYKDEWRTDLSLFVRYDCDSVATSSLTSKLAQIDTTIMDSFFYNYGLTTKYTLDSCINDCPDGYTYNVTSGLCEKIDSASATFNGTPYIVEAGDNGGGSYSDKAVFYESIESRPLPIRKDETASQLEDDDEVWLVKNYQLESFWVNYLDDVGVWDQTSDPTGEWIGFSTCIEVPETKVYNIGIAADNQCRFYINGTPIVLMDGGAKNYYFNYWHVVPVKLKEGTNIIEMYGLNNGSIAAFGAEIYDIPQENLVAVSTKNDLKQYILFSSKDLIGTGTFDLGTNAGYSCPSGYALNLCGDSIICTSIDRQEKINCPCPEYLDARGYPIKDVHEILNHYPVDLHTARLEAEVTNYNDEVDTVSLYYYNACDTLFTCQTICRLEERARKVNPFVTGLRGNWRPYRSWTYVEDREYDATKADPQNDGTFAGYSDFWSYNSGQGTYIPNSSDNKWVWTSEITEYSPFGMELENKDPLGRYSSALYGYSQTLPTAVASNTRHRQLWYEGFEEYTYMNTIFYEQICPQFQFAYDSTFYNFVEESAQLDQNLSHTGNVSLKLAANDSLVQELPLSPDFTEYSETVLGAEFITNQEDQIIPFRPTPGKYVASVWVHQDSSTSDTLFEHSFLVIEFEDDLGQKTRTVYQPSGYIIEGWQRINVVIDVPEDAEIMRIKYVSGDQQAWFDDLRIFPYNGNMKSYAYDFRTMRLMAELDENNYATFYEYDLEGNLVRIKKETERGVKTLQETRQHQAVN